MTATYRRTGGGWPSLDEQLEIDPDGTFRMTRVVSADRVGRFGGTLDDAHQQRLRSALTALGDPIDIEPAMPGAVLELIDWDGGSASFPLHADLPAEWQELRELMHALLVELREKPVAALEISVDDGGESAVFTALGEQPVDVRFDDGAALKLTLFGEDESYLDTKTVPVPADLADAGRVDPGWRSRVRLDHGLPFTPQRTLQLSVEVSVDGREGKLTCVAGKGWS